MARPARFDVLGVRVSAINQAQAVEQIAAWLDEGAHQYVCVTGVHGVMESQDDKDLKEIHNQAGMVTPDGMPLVWIGRRRGFRHMTRVYGPDLMLAVCEDERLRSAGHFFYGGAPSVPEELAGRLKRRFPGLKVAGCYSPPFRPLTQVEEKKLIERIDDSGAEMVWVGLSTPKQERWMAQFTGRLRANVLLGVGAAFDFHSGRKKQAPKWMQRSGLEWFYRSMTEPRRLLPRYLKSNPRFIGLVLRDAIAGALTRNRPA